MYQPGSELIYDLAGELIVTSLFKLYAEHIMRNEGQDESQAGLKICRGVNSLRRQILTTLMADSKGTKEPPDE